MLCNIHSEKFSPAIFTENIVQFIGSKTFVSNWLTNK